MEHRHSISKPRLSSCDGDGVKDGPAWEVDIIRDGTLVVDTFVLNNDILPPRKNKKGKVLWCLPNDVNKTPSFGIHETSRILDIFKDRKKKRKKQLKESGGKAGRSPKKKESQDENSEDRSGAARSDDNAKSKKAGENTGKSDEVAAATVTDKDTRVGKHPQLQAARMRLGGIGQRQNKKQHRSDLSDDSKHHLIQPSSTQTDATDNLTNESTVPDNLDPSRLSLNDEMSPAQQQSPLETSKRESNVYATPSKDALFIIVPHNELPKPLPGEAQPSLAVPVARYFANIYYQYFSSSQINDLARYYTTKGQKSVSIGGAHSVVTGRNDITTQILSLAGTSFVVRGVVSQDTVDGKGAHILVTGSAVTGSGGVSANFAHSVSLTRVEPEPMCETSCSEMKAAFTAGVPFQIHNDALALLSGEAASMTQPRFTPPSPAHQPPPPPGLF